MADCRRAMYGGFSDKGAHSAAGGGLPHGRYVNVLIVFGLVLSVNNSYVSCRLALGDGSVDRGSFGRRPTSSTSSSSRSRQSREAKTSEKLRRAEEQIATLVQSQQQMQYTMMMVIILTSAISPI